MEFTAVDIVILVVLLVTAVRCAFRGFVAEIMAFAAVIVGLVAAVLFGGMVAPLLARYLGETVWTPVASFLGIFLVAYIVVKIFEGALYRLIEKIRLEKMDQALGFFLGAVEGVLIVALLLVLVRIQPIFDPDPLFRGSFFVPLLEKMIPVGSGIIEGALQNSRV